MGERSVVTDAMMPHIVSHEDIAAMDLTIDQLAADLHRGTTLQWKNTTKFKLEYREDSGGVMSGEFIPKGTKIGVVPGTPTYVWDITHAHYMFVNDDQVLDVGHVHPRPLITMIRNENDTWSKTNCTMLVEHDDVCHNSYVVMYACEDIFVGDELVYGFDRPAFEM